MELDVQKCSSRHWIPHGHLMVPPELCFVETGGQGQTAQRRTFVAMEREEVACRLPGRHTSASTAGCLPLTFGLNDLRGLFQPMIPRPLEQPPSQQHRPDQGIAPRDPASASRRWGKANTHHTAAASPCVPCAGGGEEHAWRCPPPPCLAPVSSQ